MKLTIINYLDYSTLGLDGTEIIIPAIYDLSHKKQSLRF